jgi:hypothetical protein
LRLPPAELAALDAWIKDQPKPRPSRPRAIRRLIELGLTVKTAVRQASEGQKLSAREMAGKAIDKMTDTATSPDDQAARKKCLLKGPKNFAK